MINKSLLLNPSSIIFKGFLLKISYDSANIVFAFVFPIFIFISQLYITMVINPYMGIGVGEWLEGSNPSTLKQPLIPSCRDRP